MEQDAGLPDPRLAAAPPPATKPARFSNLQLRLMTASIGLPLLVAVIWVGGWPFAVVAAAIALLAAAEFTHGWLLPTLPIRYVFAQAPLFGASGLMTLGAHGDERYILAGLLLAALAAGAGYAPSNIFGPRKPWRVQAWSLLYVGVPMAMIVLTRDVEQGRKWVFLGILATFAVDTGAYATGRLFGRHLLAPKVSPKKTWEGAIGGYVAGVAAAFALNALFDTGVPASTLAHFALVFPVLSQLGDLFESWMKRRMGIKDSSGLLPGHGGFLDRLDSVVVVLPFLYLFLQVRVL
ncbi:MAG: phosphatidate cytidylyltransferase [Dehalococcoidia bacterium]|nr:phosphatidate cytidylyltransferase [Dehalococcoidia bacterium]